MEGFSSVVDCDSPAVRTTRKNKTSLSAKPPAVIHTVWLLGEKEQLQEREQPILLDPREPSISRRGLLFKCGLIMGKG